MAYDPDEGDLFDIHWPVSVSDLLSVCFFNTLAVGYVCVIIGADCVRRNPVQKAIRSRRVRKALNKTNKARREQLPVPLPLKRDRALSLPLPELGDAVLPERKQVTSDQLNSLFFRLPLEIREDIYMYVFAAGNSGFVIHPQTRPKRVGHSCGRPNVWSHTALSTVSILPLPTFCDNHAPYGLLALPLACRRIYTEAIDFLYSKPTFFFNDPQDLIYFARSVLPHRLNAVRSIEMTWDGTSPDRIPIHAWVHAWIIMSQMNGIREMRVKLGINAFFHGREDTVRPLIRVTGLDVFELIVPPETVEGIGNWAFLPQMQAPFTIFEGSAPLS